MSLSEEWREGGSFGETLPIVVHIVFDEMMSPGAIDLGLATGTAMRDRIHAFGNAPGLRISDSVHSRSSRAGEGVMVEAPMLVFGCAAQP